MSKDIEDFLKLAAERRRKAQNQANQAQQQPRQQPPRQQQPMRQQPPRQQQPQRQPPRQVPREPDIVYEAEPVEKVRTLLKPSIDTSHVSEHASHLGERVQREENKTERHIQETFDHKVGRLAQKKSKPSNRKKVTAGAGSPKNLIKMLSNPDSIRQAVLLSEILRRPEDLWE